MIKTITRLELTVVDKVYHFVCDPDSPIEHCKEALFQFQKIVGQIEDDMKAKQAQSEVKPDIEPAKVEEVAQEA